MRQDHYEGDGNQYGANYGEGRADPRYRNNGYAPNNNNAIVPNNNALNNMLAAHLRPQANELQGMLDQVGEAGELAQMHQYRNEQREEGWWLNPITGISRAFGNRFIEKRNAEGQMTALKLNAAASQQRVEVARDLTIKTIDAQTTKALKAADLYDGDQKRTHDQIMKDKDVAMKREKLAHKRNINESQQAHSNQFETLKADLEDRNDARKAERQERLMRTQAQLERENMQAQAAIMRGQGPARQRPAPAEEPSRPRGAGFFNGRRRPEEDEGAEAEQGFDNN